MSMTFHSNRITFDYSQICSLIDCVVDILRKTQPSIIVAIGRGGFIPGVHMSHQLGIPLEPLMWQIRDGQENVDRTINTRISTALESGFHVVFVDDINDSGTTFSQILETYSPYSKDSIYTCCLVEKTITKHPCDIAGIRVSDSRWLVMPWENG